MLILGHAGLALGAATVLAGALDAGRSVPGARPSWFASLSNYIDVRLLVLGSLLPDIIDKPLGQYIFPGTFGSGRIFAHSLLFLVVIAVVGIVLYKRRRSAWMLTLAAGVFTHILFDSAWRSPVNLLWPLLGFEFPRIDLAMWLPNIFEGLVSDPRIYVPEILGLAVLLWFGVLLVRRRRVAAFLRYGKTG